MTESFFHKSILLRNGNFVAQKKAAECLFKLTGGTQSVLSGEIIKRAQSAPYNHRILDKDREKSDITFPDEKNDKSMRYCPDCIAEQHYHYGHGWLKREWLFNFRCLIHNKRLLRLVDMAQELEVSLFEVFESILRAGSSISGKNLLELPKFENRPCIIAPCLLIDFFKSTAQKGKFDFHEFEEPLPNVISLLYQYLNCFPHDEKAQFARYVRDSAKSWSEYGMCFYKSSQPCLACPYQEYCSGLRNHSGYRDIDEADVQSVLEWIFQRSDLPDHISERNLLTYSNVKEYLSRFYEPNTFEADTVEWLMILMCSTFGAHTEFVSRDRGGLTFESIRREPISGLLALRLKRERVNSSHRVVLLPRSFEDDIQWYIGQRSSGVFRLTDPIVASKSGLKSLLAVELRRIVREPFKQLKNIPSEGLNLHSIRDVIAASAIASGANAQYIVKASGLSTTPLVRESVLPL